MSPDYRIILAEFDNFTIINCYGYTSCDNSEMINFFSVDSIPKYLNLFNKNPIILGDFNYILNPNVDGNNRVNFFFTLIISKLNFIDTSYHLNPNLISPTFINHMGRTTIYKIFLHRDNINHLINFTHQLYTQSDHLAFILDLNIKTTISERKI